MEPGRACRKGCRHDSTPPSHERAATPHRRGPPNNACVLFSSRMLPASPPKAPATTTPKPLWAQGLGWTEVHPPMLPEQAWSRRRAPHLHERQSRGATKERRQKTSKRSHRENTSPHHERSRTLYAGIPPSYECAGHSMNARRHQQPTAPLPPSTKYERTRRSVNARGLPIKALNLYKPAEATGSNDNPNPP